MPRKGYKCLTVTEKVHQEMKLRAKEKGCTIKEYIEYLMTTDNRTKEGK